MRSVGIDLGRYSIKVVEIVANNRTYQISRAKEYRILNPESNDQEIEILQTLKQVSKDFETEDARVACSVRQQFVSTRKLFFPFKERIKIQKSLAFELEDDIPLAMDKTIYDSKVIKFHEKAAEVVALACVSEEIEKTIDLFNRGRIDPDIVTPEFCAIANLYEKWYRSPEDVSAESEDSAEPDKLIVHIGHSKTFVGVVSNKHLVWGRSVMWGAESVASEIAQTFSVPFLTALDMMPTKAFLLLSNAGANEEQIKMSKAVAKSLSPVVQALRLTKMLAETDYGAKIEVVEILGAPSQIKNLGPYLTENLEIPCNPVDPLEKLNERYMRSNVELSEVFQMSLGLAIEGLRRPVNPAVNFRQMHLAKKNHSLEKYWDKWGYTAKIVCIAWFAYLVYGVALDTISTNLEATSSDTLVDQAGKIAKLKGGSATHSRIRSYVKSNNKKAKLVKVYDQISEVNSPIQWINDISQILPSNKKNKNYEVRRFFVKDNQVNIQGVAEDQASVDRILRALKGVAINSNVKTVPATIQNEASKKRFAFTFKVKRKN